MTRTAAVPLHPVELASVACPIRDCGETPVDGTLRFEDRGQFQQIAIRSYVCPDGHRWTDETDGG